MKMEGGKSTTNAEQFLQKARGKLEYKGGGNRAKMLAGLVLAGLISEQAMAETIDVGNLQEQETTEALFKINKKDLEQGIYFHNFNETQDSIKDLSQEFGYKRMTKIENRREVFDDRTLGGRDRPYFGSLSKEKAEELQRELGIDLSGMPYKYNEQEIRKKGFEIKKMRLDAESPQKQILVANYGVTSKGMMAHLTIFDGKDKVYRITNKKGEVVAFYLVDCHNLFFKVSDGKSGIKKPERIKTQQERVQQEKIESPAEKISREYILLKQLHEGKRRDVYINNRGIAIQDNHLGGAYKTGVYYLVKKEDLQGALAIREVVVNGNLAYTFYYTIADNRSFSGKRLEQAKKKYDVLEINKFDKREAQGELRQRSYLDNKKPRQDQNHKNTNKRNNKGNPYYRR